MNQVTNKVPYGLLTEDEQKTFNTKDFTYQSWASGMWINCVFEHSYIPREDGVYRLVIEPEKWYYFGSFGSYGIHKGCYLTNIENASECRPAKQSEIPQPVTLKDKIKAKYSGYEVVMCKWNTVAGIEKDLWQIFGHINHGAAQSMKGFQGYVFQRLNDKSLFIDCRPVYPWNELNALQPIAVLFEKGE